MSKLLREYVKEILEEGVEFRELDSPLRYNRATGIKRLALCDTSVQEPNLSPSGRPMSDAYFNEKQEWEYYGRGKSRNRRLKKVPQIAFRKTLSKPLQHSDEF